MFLHELEAIPAPNDFFDLRKFVAESYEKDSRIAARLFVNRQGKGQPEIAADVRTLAEKVVNVFVAAVGEREIFDPLIDLAEHSLILC